MEKLGASSHEEMFLGAKAAYFQAADAIGAKKILPSGEAVCLAMKEKTEGMELHRDEIHLSLSLGRYIVGLVWYGVLTGKDLTENSFCDFDGSLSRGRDSVREADRREGNQGIFHFPKIKQTGR